jgi:hypothetical protein
MIIDIALANDLFTTIDFGAIDLSAIDLTNNFDLDWQTFAAPQQFNQDVTKDIAGGWNNFVRTGQVWALIIGIVLGYLFKSVTSF